MAIPIPNVRARYFDDNGDPLAGGKVYTYIAGTSTPKSTFTSPAGDTQNANPVILDSDGYGDIWLGTGSYKFVLADADDNILWTEDNIEGQDESAEISPTWNEHAVTNGQSATNLTGETVDLADYSSAEYNCEIRRGTTVAANGPLAIQHLNGTGRVVLGGALSEELHGVTFSVSQASTVVQLKAALDSGAGNGTIKLSRRLVPA